jgi:hypothetical protein
MKKIYIARMINGMFRKNKLLFMLSLLMVILSVVGCSTQKAAPDNTNNNIITDTPAKETPLVPSSPPSTGLFSPKYRGTILAGEEAPYIEFNEEDYTKATEDGKIILLYFYSLQSASSIADQTTIHAAFNEMTNPNIIGFRVNIDDDSTSAAEVKLASDLGVKIAGTRAILKDGIVLQKSTTKWNANTYIIQLTQYLD